MLKVVSNLWKLKVWNRTPAKWVAIVFDSASNFAIVDGPGGKQLPSGLVDPDRSVQTQCHDGLALDKDSFSQREPLHLIEIEGQGGEAFTFYFSGRILDTRSEVLSFKSHVNLLSRSNLKFFVPEVIDQRVGL